MKKNYLEANSLFDSVSVQALHSYELHASYLLNLYYNSLSFTQFSLGNHSLALDLYRKINLKQDEATDVNSTFYNICLCEGIL
jgi:hypothetical protein